MNNKYTLLLAILIALGGCKKEVPLRETVQSVSTLPMKNLYLNDLSNFHPPTSNWQLAGKVLSAYEVEQDITLKSGKGVLVNILKESGNENLFTSWDHGDLELDLEFMMPKGSNSGIYFQGRYEIQLLDSWKVESPRHSDCGGIYQRWDSTAREGEEGYQGHPPAINACKAPGLWQHLYVKFIAPKFDIEGNKLSSARFDKVILNGKLIHDSVSLTGPTRASMAEDEVPKGPLMFQGDHGNVAFRNISYKRYSKQNLLLSDLTYFYYETEMSASLPDFDSLQPINQGVIDSFYIDQITKRDNFFGIRFRGKITIPKDGDYIFHTVSDDGSKMFIGGQLVVNNDFNHDMERKSGLIKLETGIYDLRVDYFNNQWGRGLAILYEGPEIEYQPLNSVYNEPHGRVSEPLIVIPMETPELIRGFVNYRNEIRTHAISVGDPKGVHYSVDLRSGTLLKCWRGEFADVSNMWRNRGNSQLVIPEALDVEMSDGSIVAVLSDENMPYPQGVSQDLKPEGYLLDKQQRPKFKYSLETATVTDSYFPSENKEELERVIEINPNGVENLYTRLATADYIELLDNGYYSIGGRYYLRLLSEEFQPFQRESDGKMELILAVNSPTVLKYSLLW